EEKAKRKGNDMILYDKDAVLFPQKINGKFVMLHRLEPDIQIVYFDKFEDLGKRKFWLDYIRNIDNYVLMKPKFEWEHEKIGAGATPIKTKKGWLLLYHGVNMKNGKQYNAGAALLDLKNPQKVITRMKTPLFKPEFEWELNGIVNNVVFPEGAVKQNKNLNVFYGCADSRIGMARFDFRNLMDNLAVA
ncbi:pesticidal protein Cry7Aa, partial [Candidatus Woesearchaeota archaeon]|nr:pesticidal protein Cry7Aa [Candidatus Woesearchaeota archaeon]